MQSWNMIHAFRDSVLVCKMHDCIWYAKISSISIPSHQAMQAITMNRLNENKPLKNACKRIKHCIYLFKFYSILITLFLENNLTNICREISKVGLNL